MRAGSPSRARHSDCNRDLKDFTGPAHRVHAPAAVLVVLAVRPEHAGEQDPGTATCRMHGLRPAGNGLDVGRVVEDLHRGVNLLFMGDPCHYRFSRSATNPNCVSAV